MERFRDHVQRDPSEFLKAVSFYSAQSAFALEGETYKRTISNQLPAEFQPWYQKRNLYVTSNRTVDDVLFQRSLVNMLADGYATLAPLYRYLLASSAPQ